MAADSCPAKKIVVIGPSWVGDMVMAQAMFASLATQNPGCILDVVAPSATYPLLARMGEVSKGWLLDVEHGQLAVMKRYRMGLALRHEAYDRAYVLPNSFKSALVPVFAGIPERIGWRGEGRFGVLNDLRILSPSTLPLMVERFVSLAYDKGVELPQPLCRPRLTTDQDAAADTLRKLQLELHRPILALCPGAEYGVAKQWPVAHYGLVAEHFLALGWQVWVFGSRKDITTAGRLRDRISPQLRDLCFDLTGKTSLPEVVDLMALVEVVLTNDSGLMHIAAALDRQLFILYGSSSPQFTPPLCDQATIISLDLPCSPCFKRTCPLGHTDCLNELKADRVLEEMKSAGV
ncbi:MAG: lipopolysaccharide heptosyltransferase II [Pseudomonadales bacterium]|jgi:heptosyltransferase-2|nr:lipopolysaccharide heptosyltransferase II [Pseudomonadales bacterium]MDP7144064.1 lipopolysaccharide heptosyltransferase II [Pseudomonadales bacterium]MDP7596527.1 lipopolysaccharide heptosyltransferase II [Pseudomonadales bacterium]HJN50240.1 lipopolysaccharide heptosyltransferase II [Pseudomonadales bacterium]|tara:strand:- start:1217 stop:2260 length:1044 start_codon:yes stop_codon:yes gene_type:complete